ncbi:MAG: hypothetical protein P4L85_26675 [Paludisphaera borealis]|uniref:hypothetical protein n=1 Tax=Paludisphaera borealis TaxID=1387353 RepID=UPI00283F8621|nr:hypothetical protein [Paludisphaera borealis]MDR3622967.1 hypothetical protein [Paludisphaera borealis]
MTLPGFTADAALTTPGPRFRARLDQPSRADGRGVHPAFLPFPIAINFCWYECFTDPTGHLYCHRRCLGY